MMRNERIVISRQRLLDEVWGYDPFSTTNTIEVFVSNLRRKLEAEGQPRLLHTIRGAGDVLRACGPQQRPTPRARAPHRAVRSPADPHAPCGTVRAAAGRAPVPARDREPLADRSPTPLR